MRTAITAYIATLLAFLLLDGLWLGVWMGPTYRAFLGASMLAQPLPGPAVAFYLLYVLGIVVFVVLPSVTHGRWLQAAGRGALLGLVAYGTYDLSNWATLQIWSAPLALMDMAWGMVATCLAGLVGYWAANRFSPV